MSEIIYRDEDGNETKREPKGRGRPPAGSIRQENGDFVVVIPKGGLVSQERISPEYITVDELGNEIVSRVAKGRGRPKPDFVKHETGPFKGHWVKVVKSEQTVNEDEAKDEAITVVETQETVST